MDAACRELGIQGIQVTHSSTAPILDLIYRAPWSLNDQSPEFNRAAMSAAVSQKVQVVIMAAMWAIYAEDPTFETKLKRTVDELASHGLRVIIVRDMAKFSRDVPRALAQATCLGERVDTIGIALAKHREDNRQCDAALDQVAGRSVFIIDPADYFVDANGFWPAERDGISMYRDEHHLTVEGALRLTPLFKSNLQEKCW
jgi:hypothetical protein